MEQHSSGAAVKKKGKMKRFVFLRKGDFPMETHLV